MEDVQLIEIEYLTIQDLKKELQKSVFFEGQHILPITKHRALSHVNNPRAEAHDVVLLLAKKQHQICGYIGMMPDYLFHDSKKYKVAWLSTWWVAPELKGQGLGYKLMNEAFNCYNDNIFAVAVSPHSQKVYQQSGRFNFLPIAKNFNFIFKYPENPNISFFKKIALNSFNKMNKLHLNFWIKKNKIPENIDFLEVDEISDELYDFIVENNFSNLFKWNKSELEWVLKYPWVLSEKKKEEKYYFSSFAQNFLYKLIVIKKESKISAFLVLRIRDNFFTIPYLFANNENSYGILEVIVHYIKKYNALALTTNHELLLNLIKEKKLPFLKKDSFSHKSVVSKKFTHINFSEYEFQFGFGDAIFT